MTISPFFLLVFAIVFFVSFFSPGGGGGWGWGNDDTGHDGTGNIELCNPKVGPMQFLEARTYCLNST